MSCRLAANGTAQVSCMQLFWSSNSALFRTRIRMANAPRALARSHANRTAPHGSTRRTTWPKRAHRTRHAHPPQPTHAPPKTLHCTALTGIALTHTARTQRAPARNAMPHCRTHLNAERPSASRSTFVSDMTPCGGDAPVTGVATAAAALPCGHCLILLLGGGSGGAAPLDSDIKPKR